MRVLIVGLIMLAAFAGSSAAETQEFHRGIGVIFGEPTGIDFKVHINEVNAFEAAVAWSLSSTNNLHLQLDYLIHKYGIITVSKGQLPIFFGIGGRVEFREDADDLWGARVPVGVDYYFESAPFDIFGEIVPVVDIYPDLDLNLEGAIGARFWF